MTTDIPIFNDKQGKEHAHSWPEVHAAARRVVEYFEWLKGQFINRDKMIDALMYALLLREHILVFGESGTAKSAVVSAAVRGITGAQLWQKQFTRFTKPTDVFGGIDARVLRDTGAMHYITTGGLLEADVAVFDEFLDASPDMLRTLLNITHERRFQNGSQQIPFLPLRTAIATTNHNPSILLADDTRMQAVVDRFMFWLHIDQLFNEDDLVAMVHLYQTSAQQTHHPEISLEDIDLISSVVRHLDLFNGDTDVMRAYARIAMQMRDQYGWFSDRHIAKVSKVLELQAILRGRPFVDVEDIMAARVPLTRRFDDTDNPFEDITSTELMEWRSTRDAEHQDPHLFALRVLERQYRSYTTATLMTNDDLVEAVRKVAGDRTSIMNMADLSDEAAELRTELANTLHAFEQEIQLKIAGGPEAI